MSRTPSADLAGAVDELAASAGFAGVVRVDVAGEPPLELAHGLADRAHGVAHTPGTRIAIASGAKTFTALAVMRLVERGVLALDTRARDLLGADLPLIDDAVTVQHLLSHRSGIGDYLDEDVYEDVLDYELPVPAQSLDTAESYLPILDGYPQKFAPGTAFSYCNGGYAVLALLAERASGTPFHALVEREVIDRAGLTGTAYLRSDELPGDAALGYLHAEGLRTNVFHLPVVGGGDGGIYTTAGDVAALWEAFDGGGIVSAATREEMVRARSEAVDEDEHGLGVRRWGAALAMEGCDAGASFRSVHLPGLATWTVLSNTADGAWPVASRLGELLIGSGPPR